MIHQAKITSQKGISTKSSKQIIASNIFGCFSPIKKNCYYININVQFIKYPNAALITRLERVEPHRKNNNHTK